MSHFTSVLHQRCIHVHILLQYCSNRVFSVYMNRIGVLNVLFHVCIQGHFCFSITSMVSDLLYSIYIGVLNVSFHGSSDSEMYSESYFSPILLQRCIQCHIPRQVCFRGVFSVIFLANSASEVYSLSHFASVLHLYCH